MITEQCVCCGGKDTAERFQDTTITIDFGGRRVDVHGLSGRQCRACQEIVLNADSCRRYADAGDELVRADREAKLFAKAALADRAMGEDITGLTDKELIAKLCR
jgi:YgiT-type zinc finger domain-containing protein